MQTETIRIEGFDELLKYLTDAPEIAKPAIGQALADCASMVHDAMTPYPPETASNMPGRWNGLTRKPMGYYERGAGWWYPVRGEVIHNKRAGTQDVRRLKDYKLFAQRYQGIGGYKLRKTSERLQASWSTSPVTFDQWGAEVEIGNNASYVEYVQGAKQTKQHKAHNWQTLDQKLAELAPRFDARFERALQEVIDAGAK